MPSPNFREELQLIPLYRVHFACPSGGAPPSREVLKAGLKFKKREIRREHPQVSRFCVVSEHGVDDVILYCCESKYHSRFLQYAHDRGMVDFVEMGVSTYVFQPSLDESV